MSNRLKEKIDEIEGFLVELEESVPLSEKDYLNNKVIQRVCERLFEVILEAVVDLIFLYINEKKMDMPEDDESALELLSSKGIISSELCKRLREARRMRNIIAHKYGSINSYLVFQAVSIDLNKDANELIKCIRMNL